MSVLASINSALAGGLVALVLTYLVAAALVGELGAKRGRSHFGWIVIGLIWPVGALVAVMCLGPTEAEAMRRAERDEEARLRVREDDEAAKKLIRAAAEGE